jgi:phosphatidylglycerol:prolipoprotein diacylglycerol transferase
LAVGLPLLLLHTKELYFFRKIINIKLLLIFMFVHNIDPNLITIGDFSIRLYGIFYAVGFLVTAYYLVKKSKKIKNLNKDKAIDLVTYGMLFGIIGARLLHVLIEIKYYINNPIVYLNLFSLNIPVPSVLAVWQGGLAFFGGILGAVLSVYFFCKRNKINFLEVADVVVVPTSFFVSLVRITNFINGEHVGKPTNLPWAVIFPFYDNIPRHPAQIYESISMLIMFFILFFLGKKKHKKGFIFYMFLIIYGIFRFITEFFRQNQPNEMFVFLSISQYLSILVFGIGAYYLLKLKK